MPDLSSSSLLPSLGCLGAGNMAGAILRGTIDNGVLPAERVWACDLVESKLEELKTTLGIQTTRDPLELVRSVQTLVLAVKPQNILEVVKSIAPAVTTKHRIISIAAGTPIARLAEYLPPGTAIVRVMPNTPALVGEGAAGVAAGPHASGQDLAATLELFRAIGIAYAVEEKDLDAVTALSGSGPAYVFRCMEIMSEAGEAMGLAPETARGLSLQTFLGAARLAKDSGDDPAELRRRVTSPGGTTAAALQVFEERGLADVLKAGMESARLRSIELAKPKDA